MQNRSAAVPGSRAGFRLRLAGLAITLICLGFAAPAVAGDAEAQPSGAGMRLYRDPATGRIGAPAPNAVLDTAPAAAARIQASDAARDAEMLEPGPGGGKRMRLNGRFRAVVRRQVDSAPECIEAGAAAHE